MNLRYNYCFILSLLWAVICCSCKQDSTLQKDSSTKKYSIYTLGKDDKNYLIETNTLDSGTCNPEQKGTLLDEQEIGRDLIVHQGNYYHLNRKKAVFSKYGADCKEVLASLSLPDFSLENYQWISADTLLLSGLGKPNFLQAEYLLVDTKAMKIISKGDMEIPKPSGKFDSMSIGFTERRGDELYIGYTYHQSLSGYDYTTSDTSYFSVLSYPQMKLIRTEKDTRTTYPGGINTVQRYYFHDEQQDFYFMSCPGIALGNRPDLRTAIMRWKSGTRELDKAYFFDLSGSVIQNHAYGMWYLGKGQAIVRSERKDLFKSFRDHHSTPHFEFYLVDIYEAKVLKKLPLPLDKGTRRECVLVQGERAYISINSAAEGNYLWIYDIKTGGLKKGLKLGDQTNYILRIDQLNP